ncbi:hypothetical protein HN51_069424 [Arachis hypogaea]
MQKKQQPNGQQEQEQDQGLVSESKLDSEEASKPDFRYELNQSHLLSLNCKHLNLRILWPLKPDPRHP